MVKVGVFLLGVALGLGVSSLHDSGPPTVNVKVQITERDSCKTHTSGNNDYVVLCNGEEANDTSNDTH